MRRGKVARRLNALDTTNVMLGAVAGAVVANSESFHPTTLAGAGHCFLIVLLIIGFAANCQWTIAAHRSRKTGLTAILLLLFVFIEIVLAAESVAFDVSAGGGSFNLHFYANSAGGLVMSSTFFAMYVVNILIAFKRNWFEGTP